MDDPAAAIVETARLTEEKRELSEEQKQIINVQLRELQSRLKTDPVITVGFFPADSRKSGGSYETITGTAKKVDEYLGILEMATNQFR